MNYYSFFLGLCLITNCLGFGICQDSEVVPAPTLPATSGQTFSLADDPSNSSIRPFTPKPNQGFSGPNIQVEILRNKELLKEIEMVDEQRELLFRDVDRLTRKFEQDKGTAFARGISGDQFGQMVVKFRKDLSEIVSSNLLPHQRKRLNELRYQQQILNLINPNYPKTMFYDVLDLTPKQVRLLNTKKVETREEISAKVDQIMFGMQKELLESVLTEEQKSKLKTCLGKRPKTASQR